MIYECANKIELLAPAGDSCSLKAAIRAGADAVYLGGNKFGARAYAKNFTEADLVRAVDYAHLYERKLYLTVNTVLKNDEIKELYEFIKPVYMAGLDGVIIQDLGAVSILKNDFPDLNLHASTQMTVTDTDGVRLLQGLGIKRVVLARELSLDEIRRIHDETGTEIECFIHGALCYSYSGKCLFSSLAGGRSGNRGRCAQPCRLPYDGQYILSARDISTLQILPELAGAGICSFKIEGRMKSPGYVESVTRIYRKYMDMLQSLGKEDYRVDMDDLKELEEVYTRSGHCNGYYHMRNGRDMITVDRPSYQTADPDKIISKRNVEGNTDKRIRTDAIIKAYAGKPFFIVLSCREIKIEYKGENVQSAIKTPTDRENIIKHFDRLKNTPFELGKVKVECGEDIFIPVSLINSARREAFEKLQEEMLKGYRKQTPEDRMPVYKTGNKAKGRSQCVNVRIDRLQMLDLLIDCPLADIITVDLNEFIYSGREVKSTGINTGMINKISEQIHGKGKMFYTALPAIIRNDYFKRYPELDEILKNGLADGVIIDNYESLKHLSDIGYKGKIIADIHLYAVNDHTVKMLMDLGVDEITYPVELNAREINRLDLDRGEFIIYGRNPMMISAQCTQKTQKDCIRDNGVSTIRDRMGNRFPVVRNCNECFNTILNCVPTAVTSMNEIPGSSKPNSYRIHFTTEDNATIKEIMDYYTKMLGERDPGAFKWDRTSGHLKRGVE